MEMNLEASGSGLPVPGASEKNNGRPVKIADVLAEFRTNNLPNIRP
jgi:hypothetical protein